MFAVDRRPLPSSSNSDQARESDDKIKRLEKWSSMDSFVIANRTRIPSIRPAETHPAPSENDLNIARNLLLVESETRPQERRKRRTLSAETPSSAIYSIMDSDPFRTQTPSDNASQTGFQPSSKTPAGTSATVIVHSEDLATLEMVLHRHGISYVNFDGVSDKKIAEQPFPPPLFETVAGSKMNVIDPNTSDRRDSHSVDDHRLGQVVDKADNVRDFPLTRSDQLPRNIRHNSEPLTSVEQHRLRSSATCPLLRLETDKSPEKLARSSKSMVNLARAASMSHLRIMNKDHPFKGQSVKDLARKLGVNLIDLPSSLSPSTLGLPICYSRPLNYLINADASAHKIFCTPINQRLVTLYCSTFTDLLKGVQGGATIVATVAGNRFPQTKKLSNFDKADRPAEVGAALFKMLEDLPIGVMGSVTMFDSIHQALRIWDDGRTELARTESLPLARFIAKIISKIPDILQLHLLCAIFGFMHGLNKQDSDTEILAQVLAPVMLNSKMDEIGLSQNETTKTDRMRQVKQTCRKLLGLPAKETQKLKKLEICKYVAAGLISIWAPIMKQMKELEGDTPVLDDVQTPRSGGTTAHGSES